jgi:hypothetical protein
MSAPRVVRFAVVALLVAAGTYAAGVAPAAAAVNPLVCTVQDNGNVTVRYSGIEAHLPAGTYTLDILQRVGQRDNVKLTKLASTTRAVSAGGFIGFKGSVTQSHKQGRIVDVLRKHGETVRRHHAAWDCT